MKITKQYSLPFPLENVYAAWISSGTVIEPATAMDINPVVGGHYRLIMETPELQAKNEGIFSVVEPESRLVYTWEWNDDGQVTTIDVRFSRSGNGTRVDLEHTGFSDSESRDNHDSGWDSYIEGFSKFLTRLA